MGRDIFKGNRLHRALPNWPEMFPGNIFYQHHLVILSSDQVANTVLDEKIWNITVEIFYFIAYYDIIPYLHLLSELKNEKVFSFFL